MIRALGSWLLRRRVEVPHGREAPEAPDERPVPGDRGITLASRARSLQARLNMLLAAALTIAILVATLLWYYTEVVPPGAASHTAQRRAVHSVGGGEAPPLGAIPPPQLIAAPPAPSASGASRMPVPPAQRSGRARADAALRRFVSTGRGQTDSAAVAWRRARRRAGLARRLSGGVLIGASSVARRTAAAAVPTPERVRGRIHSATPRGSRLDALLRASVMRATRAKLLPQRRLLLSVGTSIDCTLETAIDSTLPGMTTCITATDTFSADGEVVLLPRGTLLIGQTRGEVRQGMARVFVIWTQARTPSGVVVRLDSPATDALGRSGLTGRVNRHFWQRFGAALLISTLTGVMQSRLESAGGTLIVDPTASEDVLTESLRSAQDIAPTIDIANGQRIEVLVARDVDFSSVYELRAR